jgi:hypothetical protein
MDDLVQKLQAAQAELEPQFRALRGAIGALNAALRLASAPTTDAPAHAEGPDQTRNGGRRRGRQRAGPAVAAFAAATQSALDDLAFDFAKDLRAEFGRRGETVEGRPPALTVNLLTFKIDMAARKGQWLYGREPLTKPIPLSLVGIIKAYDRQVKRVVNRELEKSFLFDLQKAWQDCLDKRKTRPSGGRVNIVEVYSQLTLNRQSARFWNAPSRSTFKDYERDLFVRDLALALAEGEAPFRLGVASKNQAEQASRSIWLPDKAIEGQYYSDITFDN